MQNLSDYLEVPTNVIRINIKFYILYIRKSCLFVYLLVNIFGKSLLVVNSVVKKIVFIN